MHQSDITRRDFLCKTGLGITGLALLPGVSASSRARAKACIQLVLVGGPSQLDTWDPKPNAPAEIRGPFRPIHTNVPGIQVSEIFPLMARRADRFAIVRSVHHHDTPVHETGLQLIQTGHLFTRGVEWPHMGAVLTKLRSRSDAGSWVTLACPLLNNWLNGSPGQGAGFLGPRFEPFGYGKGQRPIARIGAAAARDCERYGYTLFGQLCLLARRLVERGVRFVTVNMFDTVFHRITWDCHASGGELPATLADYGETLGPMLDRAYTALLDDLEERGLLAETLVLCAGEFGRTPRVNPGGGRDHWPGVWSILLAGGGVRGGQVIGASDAHAAEPKDRPVAAAEIVATVYDALGIDARTRLPGPDGQPVPLVDARGVRELF